MKKSLFLISFLLVTFYTFSQKKAKKITPVEVKNSNTSAIISAADRLSSYSNRLNLEKTSLVKNIEFRSVGPSVMSGRVADLDVNEADPSEFYVGYAMGGLWHTTNNGQSFSPLFDKQPVITIGDIAIDWKSTNKTIWVGTGESSSSRSTYAGLGIFKSEDNGKTWQQKGLAETQHIGKIKIHPTDPNTLWVAAVGHLYTPNKERGIYKTTDGGTTWKNTLFVDENTGGIDLQVDTNNPKIIYACMWQKKRSAWNFEEGGQATGIYRSDDGGETWRNITNAASGFPQGNTNGRVGLAITNGNSNIVYAVIDNQAKQADFIKKEVLKLDSKKIKLLSKDAFLALTNAEINTYLDENNFPANYSAKSIKEDLKTNKYTVESIAKFTENANDDLFDTPIKGAEVYKSIDGGTSWKRTHNNYLEAVFNTYGYYFGTIHVSPTNPEKIIIPGFQIIKSENGGKTFKNMNAPNVHADHHSLWINPKNDKHMILGNDGGINITYDDGANWIFANTPALGMLYAVNVDMATPYNVYGGLQDNGVWTGPSNYKADNAWYSEGQYPYKSIMGGDGMQVAIDTRDNNTVYTGYQFGNYYRINKTTGESKYLQMPQEIGGLKNRFNWQTPILLSKHNQDILYLGGNKLFRSMDKGDNWIALSADLTKGGRPGDVPFGTLTTISESPIQFGILYVGTDDGNVQISRDGGYNFTNISNGLPQNLWVSRVIASKHKLGRVFVSLSGYRNDDFNTYLYKSENFGETWAEIGKNLPKEPLNVVKEDLENEKLIYVGTDHGLYVSLDLGINFMSMTNNLPNVPVHDLIVHPRDKELVIGTHGRSIYIADVKHLQQMTDSLLAKNLQIFHLKTINHSSRWGKYNWSGKYEDIKPQEFAVPFYSKTSENATFKIQTKGGYILKKWYKKIDDGLNFEKWDLTIDSTTVFDYQIQLNGQRKSAEPEIILEPADDQKVYIKQGKYNLIIETESGQKTEKEIEVKSNERVSKREN